MGCLFGLTLLLGICGFPEMEPDSSVQGQVRRGPRPIPLPPGPMPVPMVPISPGYPPGNVPGSPLPAGVPPVPAPVPPPALSATPLPFNPQERFQGEIHLELSQRLLQMVVSRQETDFGPVQDFILGAVVTGQQSTVSRISVDCIPSQEGAQFDFVVDGQVLSSTNAATPQANVLQQGNTLFQARKRVLLNAETIMTQRVGVQVMPNQQVTGARARPTPLPMFNNLADRIAYRAAMSRLHESNIVAGQRVMERLQPELDTKIDAKLAEANTLFREELWQRLTDWNVVPEYRAAFSSSDRLYWDYRLRSDPVPWQAPPNNEPLPLSGQPVTPGSDLVLRLHESLFETVAARRSLGGKSISLNELREATDRLLSLLAEEVPSESPKLPLAITFTFDEKRPIRAVARDNELLVYLRGTFQAGNLPRTEVQEIRLRVTGDLTAETFTIQIADVAVREVQADGSLASPGITQSAIANQIKTNLQPIVLQRKLKMPAELQDSLSLRLTNISSEEEWMIIHLDAVQSPQPLPNGGFSGGQPTFQLGPQPPTPVAPVLPGDAPLLVPSPQELPAPPLTVPRFPGS